MTQPILGNRVQWNDEQYTKVFIVLAADSRKCLVCEEVFTRLGSYHHSKSICHPTAANAN